MATRKIVPRADNEGGLGTALKRWASAFIAAITCTTINALTLTAAAVGFTIEGGTTSKTLTVDETVAMSGKAALTHGALHLPAAADPIGLPKFSAHKNEVDQVDIVTAVLTKITFPTEEYDVGNVYDAPNSKWIPGIIGKAHISASVNWLSAVDQTAFIILIYKNGVLNKYRQVVASGATAQGQSISCDVLVDVITDYFEIYVYQYSGSNKDVNGTIECTWFMGHMLP